MKRHLKRTKIKKRNHGMKLGRVIDDDSDDDDDDMKAYSDGGGASLKPRGNLRGDHGLSYSTDIILPSNHLILPISSPRIKKSNSVLNVIPFGNNWSDRGTE